MHIFRWLLSTVLFLLLTAQVNARKQDVNGLLYGNVSMGAGSPSAFKVSLAYLLMKRHEISFGYNYYSRKGHGIPSDYEARSLGPMGSFSYVPLESYSATAVTYGYVLYPRQRADRLRYVMHAGLLLGHQSTPFDYQRTSGTYPPLMYSSNYTHEQHEKTTAAITLNPTIDYTPCRWIGITGGLYAVLSEDYSGGGISLGLLLGHVGNRKKR